MKTRLINNRGIIYTKRDKEAALADFDKAIELNPSSATAYLNRGLLYGAIGDKAKAKEDFDAATKADPSLAPAYNARGQIAVSDYAVKQGRIDLDKAIKLDPRDVEAYNARGFADLRAGQPTKALEDFNKAIYLAPGTRPELFARRAHALADRGDDREALAEYEKALRLNPHLAEALFGRGNIYKKQGKLDEALVDYDEAIRLAPDQPAPLINRGVVLQTLGRSEEAFRDFTKVIEMDPPKVSAAYNNRAVVLRQMGRAEEALADFTEAIKRGENYIEPLLSRANLEEYLGDHATAVRDFETALAHAGDNPEPHNAIAWALATNPNAQYRDGALAVRYAKRACELSKWRDPGMFDTLAAAYAEIGNFAKAIRCEEKALALMPKTSGPADQLRERLQLYHAGQSYHEPSRPDADYHQSR